MNEHLIESSFIVLLMLSILYSKYGIKNKGNVLVLVFISTVQGFVLTLLFIKYLASTKQEILSYLLASPLVLSVIYFISFSYGISNIAYLLKTKQEKLEEIKDNELLQNTARVFGVENIKFRVFGGEHSFNAFVIPISMLNRDSTKIYIGKKLLNKTNKAEILFVIGHELSHIADRHGLKKLGITPIYTIFLSFVGALINYFVLLYFKHIGYFAVNLLLAPIGIMGYNAIQWYFEYRADLLAYQAIRDIRPIISFFDKFKKLGHHKHNMFFELLAYSHPSPERRIKRIQKVTKDIMA